ncbi:hypothetical protein [Mycobacterium sp. C31M]
MSTSADGIVGADVPLVTAPTIIAGLGSQPVVTVPLVGGRVRAVLPIWQRLADTAVFFDTPIPDVAALTVALNGFLAAAPTSGVLAVDVLVTSVGGQAQFVVSGSVIEPVRAQSVTLATRPFDAVPRWRQLAARTAGRADADLTARELAAAGHADIADVDGDRIGRPRFGALIFEAATATIGTGADKLQLMQAAGLLDTFAVSDEPVDLAGATTAWWISPTFERHPVAAIGTRRFEVAP